MRRGGLQLPLVRQQFGHHHIAEAQPDSGGWPAAEVAEEVVIASAAEDRAELASGIERLEHDPGVVAEPAHHGDVELDAVSDAALRAQGEQLRQSAIGGCFLAQDREGFCHGRDGQELEYGADGLGAHSLLGQKPSGLVLLDLPPLVERQEGGRVVLPRDAELQEQVGEQRPAVHVHEEVARSEPHER